MLLLHSLIPYLLVLALVANATNLKHEQRHLQLQPQPPSDYVATMLARVNAERRPFGLAPLCVNQKLNDAAQRHSNDQAAHNFIDHMGTDGTIFSDRITQAKFTWSEVAENVAAGQADVQSVMTSWMNSPGHRENILGSYTMFGTAYAYNADSTLQHHWTQEFGTSDVEACDSAKAARAPQKALGKAVKSRDAQDSAAFTSSDDELIALESIQRRDHYIRVQATDAPCTETPIVTVQGTAAPCTDAPGVVGVDWPGYEVYRSEAPGLTVNLPGNGFSGDNQDGVIQSKAIHTTGMDALKTETLAAEHDTSNV